MFEGKEVEQKIGNVGEADLDITPDLKLNAEVKIDLSRDLLPQVPGALVFTGKVDGVLQGDPVAVALFYLGKSDNAVVKVIAAELAKFRSGQAAHPAIAEAAEKIK